MPPACPHALLPHSACLSMSPCVTLACLCLVRLSLYLCLMDALLLNNTTLQLPWISWRSPSFPIHKDSQGPAHSRYSFMHLC